MMVKQGTSTATPRLRFPEFREAAAWKEQKLEELIDTVSPPAKLPTSSYLATGKFPIIDQSQDAICGWTDDAQAVTEEPLPLIVFGDHTCALKFVERPFAQGADGIKILAAKPAVSIQYLFHSLNHQPLVMEDYKRHFSTLKERRVFFPSVESGEQQKVADCLTSLDEVITAQGWKVEALKTHKSGLMQQLFPREGDTRPRLRFPEFRNTPEWRARALGELAKIQTGKKDANEGAIDGRYPFFTCAEKHIYSHGYSFDAEAILVAGNANVGQARYYKGKFEAYQRTYVLTDFAGVFVPYLYELLNANLRPALLAQVQTSAMSYIRLPMLEDFQVAIPPSVAEQQQIADCLLSLDTQITAETNQLAALKAHKQGLMQQLFPASEAIGA